MSPEPLPRCVILGGGGHARVVIDAIRLSGVATPVAILDNDTALWGHEVVGVRVLGGDDRLPEIRSQGVTYFVVGLGGVGDNYPRRRLFELARQQEFTPLTVRHPSAVCSAWATVGQGSVLLPLSVVNANAVLGVNVIVNTAAVVEHDCRIGDHAHLATGVRLSGAVIIGEMAHIGIGASIRQEIVIGDHAVVGAGAVVIEDVPSGVVVAGVPARLIREATLANR
jgi:UDP-perosamine 4-acetyltransferase